MAGFGFFGMNAGTQAGDLVSHDQIKAIRMEHENKSVVIGAIGPNGRDTERVIDLDDAPVSELDRKGFTAELERGFG